MQELKQKIIKKIKQAKNSKELEAVYRQYLGRKGELTKVLRSLKDLPEKERKEKGRLANQIKQEVSQIMEAQRKRIGNKASSKNWLDVTAPGELPAEGHLHPMTIVQRQVEDIFQSMGFFVADGPEVETEWYAFDSLNIPKDHPARDLWDTFWLKDLNLLLRPHTSPVQTRYMEKNSPPLRIIVSGGRCYRREATDATHEAVFHQVECLMIGENVSMANFKGVTLSFLRSFFGPQTQMRLIPSFFPFVEPGFQIDVLRSKKEGWLELMGAGMVHKNVFKNAGYNPQKWQGFAFGFGLDRLTMLKYKIDDIRLTFDGDMRFLKQF